VVVVIMTISNTLLTVFLTSLISLVLIHNDRCKISRSIYVCFITAQVFCFIEQFDDDDFSGVNELVMLLMSMVFSVIIVVNRSLFAFRIGNNAENNRFLVDFLNEHHQ
jgi:hypothetical protein